VSSPSSPVCLATHLTRAAASAAALRPQIVTRNDPPRALPEISPDNLPIISKDERKVAIGWDTRTWSRLCVVFFLHVFDSNADLFSHNIWLRDHCRCPKCFHSITKQRLHSTFEARCPIFNVTAVLDLIEDTT
jgi:trimethyllysine dioxygenase